MQNDKTRPSTPPSDADTVKKDADGAFGDSQADSRNNGALAIDPDGDEGSPYTENKKAKPTPGEKSRG